MRFLSPFEVSLENRGMSRWQTVLLHTVGAAGFMFLLQHFTMNATLEMSVIWAIAFGGCATGLAYMQTRR